MAEILDDIHVSTIQISNNSGLNLSSYDARIKHIGEGTLTLTSISSLDNAISIDLPNGGLDVNVEKTIDFKASDDSLDAITLQALNGGISITAAQNVEIDSNYYPGLSGLPTVHGILIGTNNTVPVFIGTSDNNTTVNGDLVVSGNFRVDGDTVQHNVTVFDSEDPLFYLNKGVTGTNTRDIGFIGERGNQQNVGFFWSEANKEFSTVGITPHGDDANNIITPIDNYKKMKCGGLSVVTDASESSNPTACSVDVNGQIEFVTGKSASDAINMISYGGVSINSISGAKITNFGNTVSLTVDQPGAADIANFTDNGSSALIVKDGGTVGINTSTPSSTYKLDVNGKTNATEVHQAGFMLVPPGSITAYAAGSAPGGWLICDGASLLKESYPVLFGVIDTTYGSVDENHFNLPNMKGRMLVGFNGADTSFDSMGEVGGSKTATLSTNELPAHTHTGTTDSAGAHSHNYNDAYFAESTGSIPDTPVYGNSGDVPDVDNSFRWRKADGDYSDTPQDIPTSTVSAHSHTITTNSTGSGNSFSIMNPYFVINYIIKY
jgi:microcystin-dependent protein